MIKCAVPKRKNGSKRKARTLGLWDACTSATFLTVREQLYRDLWASLQSLIWHPIAWVSCATSFHPFPTLFPSSVALIQSLPSPLFLSRSPRFSQLNSSGRRLHFAVSFLLERTRTSFYLIPATSEWLLLALRALYSPAQNVTKLCPWESHPCVTRAHQCACFQNQRLGTFTRTTLASSRFTRTSFLCSC